jgi:hypothetical protein
MRSEIKGVKYTWAINGFKMEMEGKVSIVWLEKLSIYG